MPAKPKLDRKLLFVSIEKEARRDWQVAKKKGEKKQINEAKKVLLHSMRMLRISIDYVERNGEEKGVNIWCVSDLVKRMKEDYSSSWETIESQYKDEFEELVEKLRKLCQ